MAAAEGRRQFRPSVTHLPPLNDPPETVLEWLVERFPRVDAATWRSRMERGLVHRGDGSVLGVDARYEAHLQVRYFRQVADEPVVPFVERIVFEDEHLIVVDKPPFLPVIPGGPYVHECLLYRLERRLGIEGLAPLHRLDRATSGLVLFSRRPAERGAYGALFAERRVVKVYEAVSTAGSGSDRRWKVESRMVRGSPFFRMREVDGTPNSRTDVKLMKTWRSGTATHGHFRLRPVTGRKHQLRVHMASLGFPILGDRFYPALQPETPDDHDEPLRLVAKELRFDDPITGVARRFVSSYDVLAKSSIRTTSSVKSSS